MKSLKIVATVQREDGYWIASGYACMPQAEKAWTQLLAAIGSDVGIFRDAKVGEEQSGLVITIAEENLDMFEVAEMGESIVKTAYGWVTRSPWVFMAKNELHSVGGSHHGN